MAPRVATYATSANTAARRRLAGGRVVSLTERGAVKAVDGGELLDRTAREPRRELLGRSQGDHRGETDLARHREHSMRSRFLSSEEARHDPSEALVARGQEQVLDERI